LNKLKGKHMRTSLSILIFFNFIFQLFATAPSNDFCQNAITLPIIHDINEFNIFDLKYATSSDPDAGPLACYSYSGNNTLKDVWFKVIVPSTGKVLVRADGLLEVGDDYIYHSNLRPTFEAYTGDCNNLQLITDSFNNCFWSNTNANTELLGLYFEGTPGEEIFVRVFDFEFNSSSAQYPTVDQFGIYAIVIDGADNTDCNSAVTLNVTQSCDLKNYRTSFDVPNSWFSFTYPANTDYVNLQILDKNFEDFAYNLPQHKVFIYSGTCGSLTLIDQRSNVNGLAISNINAGETIYIRIEFLWTTDKETFFEFCILEKTNDICSGALDIPVGGICQYMFYDTYGSTNSNNPIQDLSCYNYNPNNPDVWLKTTVPASGNVTISFYYFDPFFSFPSFEFFTGPCDNLTSIKCVITQYGIGGFTSPTHSFTGLPAGEIIYVRVVNAYSYLGNQVCAYDVIEHDECTNASFININQDCSTYPTYQYGGATVSDPNLSYSCAFANEKDLWLTFIANTSNDITLFIDNVTNQFNFFPYIDVYKGTCGNLIPVDNPGCSKGSSATDAITLQNINVGEQIFIRVVNCCFNAQGTFNVCANESCPNIVNVVSPLAVDEFKYKAEIEVSGNQLISNNARVTFQGTECVQLLPGFEVQINSYFEGNLDGCTQFYYNRLK